MLVKSNDEKTNSKCYGGTKIRGKIHDFSFSQNG